MPNWVPDNKCSYPRAGEVESERECKKEWDRRIREGGTFRLLVGSDKNASFNEFFMQPSQFVGSLGSPPEVTVLLLSLSHSCSISFTGSALKLFMGNVTWQPKLSKM